VNIFAPDALAGEQLTAGVPYRIQWSHGQPVNRATVAYSVDNGDTWTVVPGCASISQTTCVWNNPGPATEAARIRVVIEDPDDRGAWMVTYAFAIRTSAAAPLPPDWTSGDVGAVSAVGGASFTAANEQFTIKGSGADIWRTADEFHFASQTVVDDSSDGWEVTARVTSVENVSQWTKVGLMVRGSRAPGAAHASLFVTPTTAKGIAFQRRRSEGGLSVSTAGPAITAPVWLKLLVRDGVVRAYYRKLATDRWTLGSVGVPGTARVTDLTHTLEGSGADIWRTADAFRYHHLPRESISARVVSVERTDAWAKAGLMLRSNETPGSPHVMLVVTPARGIAMQSRTQQNGTSASVAIAPGAAPQWLRLTSRRSSVVGEASDDGVTWREIGRIHVPAFFDGAGSAGLAVTSHNDSTLATAVFEDVIWRP
jgi:hypothetical protein